MLRTIGKVREGRDNVTKRTERRVNSATLLETVTCGSSTVGTLTAGEIDEVNAGTDLQVG